jgi:oligoendopeptidase F
MRRLGWMLVVGLVLGASGAAAGTLDNLPRITPDGNADRDTIPDAYKWNLEDLYPTDQAWNEAFKVAQFELGRLSELHGRLGDPATLDGYLEAYFKLEIEVNRLKLYASNQEVTDTTNQESMARHQRALGLTNAFMEEGSVMRQTILAMDARAGVSRPALRAPAADGHRRGRQSGTADPGEPQSIPCVL